MKNSNFRILKTSFKSLILGCFALMLFSVVSAQSTSQNTTVPISEYQLKYWVDPYEWPLGGIAYTGKKNAWSKFLQKDYYFPFEKLENESVAFLPQWGYDSIRCLEKTVVISPFYIQRHEVTNAQYRMFLADSQSLFYTNNRITPAWVHPDTNVWLSPNIFHEPFISYYFQHPAYNEYPVVGVSQFQATQYCNWLEEKLQNVYEKLLPPGYKIQVDLPTQAEFVKTLRFWVQQPPKTHNSTRDAVKSYVISHIHTINSGPIKTLRLADIFERNSEAFLVQHAKCEQKSLCHILGNVSEWTSSRAKGKLFNRIEYVYTMSQRLIPNTDLQVSPALLEGYLYKEEDLQSHFMLKGGSYTDEFHYLDPSSVSFARGDYKSASVGFRTVIRLVKKEP
jgi:formylglycine-generating enzyme required for sulfatase activity